MAKLGINIDEFFDKLKDKKIQEAEYLYAYEKLKAFVNEIISDVSEGGGYDGGELQKIMVRHGLLIPTMVYENCGEHCACAENCTTEEFENGDVECYKKAEFLK